MPCAVVLMTHCGPRLTLKHQNNIAFVMGVGTWGGGKEVFPLRRLRSSMRISFNASREHSLKDLSLTHSQ